MPLGVANYGQNVVVGSSVHESDNPVAGSATEQNHVYLLNQGQ